MNTLSYIVLQIAIIIIAFKVVTTNKNVVLLHGTASEVCEKMLWGITINTPENIAHVLGFEDWGWPYYIFILFLIILCICASFPSLFLIGFAWAFAKMIEKQSRK